MADSITGRKYGGMHDVSFTIRYESTEVWFVTDGSDINFQDRIFRIRQTVAVICRVSVCIGFADRRNMEYGIDPGKHKRLVCRISLYNDSTVFDRKMDSWAAL